MEHIAALLLLVGCADDLRQCRELPAPTPIFETMEECDAVIGPTRRSFEGAEARVFARCVYVDPAIEEEDAELVWDITADGRLEAEVTAGNATIASHGPAATLRQSSRMAYPAPRIVRMTSGWRLLFTALRKRPTWTSTVRSSI